MLTIQFNKTLLSLKEIKLNIEFFFYYFNTSWGLFAIIFTMSNKPRWASISGLFKNIFLLFQ